MISFKEYLDQKHHMLCRIDNSVYKKCAADNVINSWLGVKFSPTNILYSANSLNESKKKYDKFKYMSEAELKTYPTDKFSRIFMKKIADVCGFIFIKFGNTLHNDCLTLKDGKIFIDDSNNLAPDGLDCFIAADYSYIEGDIAGVISYRIAGLDTRYNRKDIGDKLKTGLAEIIKAGDYCGYNYVAHQIYDAQRNSFEPEFMFESKFQTANIKISDKLYHITPLSLKDKILKYGIAPKSKSSICGTKVCHPDRVYMFNTYNEELFKDFCRAAKKRNCGYSKDFGLKYFNYDYAIFEIDRNNIPNLTLFRDNNFESFDRYKPTAVYSYTNIPPTAIKFVKSFSLDYV